MNKIVEERAREKQDLTLIQLADYGSDDEKKGSMSGGKPGPEDEHVLTAENILRTSPVYDLHRTIMAGTEVPLMRIGGCMSTA